MTEKYVVGVDVGTGSARAGVFALADGARLGMAVHPIRMWKPRPEFVEQSSDEIWSAVGIVVRAAVAEARIDPADVAGIGFDATCSLVVLGEGDLPVTVSPTGDDAQNVIVWMDHRAIAEADAINAGGADVLRFVGGKISPEMEPPKLRWLKTHLPDSWNRAVKFLDLADFLTYKASGLDVRSQCTSVCKWAYLGKEGRWDHGFFESIGIADIFDNGRVVDTIRTIGEPIGPLTSSSAAHLGLPTACQVAVGIIDAHAGGLGLLGSAFTDTSEPEALETVLALIGGTSNCHMATSREPIFVPGVWGPYYGAMAPGMYLTEGGQSAAGSLIDYVIASSPEYVDLVKQANAKEMSVYELLNERIDSLARDASLKTPAYLTRDIHVLDYHLGNRSPHADPYARGAIEGLALNSGPSAAAVQYLATIQAIAYGTREIIDAMNAQGYRIDRILATGGGTKNALFLQQHADATGMPIVLGGEPESVLLGAAILGAKASGAYASIIDAMRAMSRTGAVILPDAATRAYHDAKYEVYKSLYREQLRHREIMRGAG